MLPGTCHFRAVGDQLGKQNQRFFKKTLSVLRPKQLKAFSPVHNEFHMLLAWDLSSSNPRFASLIASKNKQKEREGKNKNKTTTVFLKNHTQLGLFSLLKYT